MRTKTIRDECLKCATNGNIISSSLDMTRSNCCFEKLNKMTENLV